MSDPQLEVFNRLTEALVSLRDVEYKLYTLQIHGSHDKRIKELAERTRTLANDVMTHINTRQTWKS